jgi:excinuclease ABC subunit A
MEGVPPVRFQYKGVLPTIAEASRVSFVARQKLDHLVREVPCAACRGSRLRDDAAAVRFADLTLGQLCDLALESRSRAI